MSNVRNACVCVCVCVRGREEEGRQSPMVSWGGLLGSRGRNRRGRRPRVLRVVISGILAPPRERTPRAGRGRPGRKGRPEGRPLAGPEAPGGSRERGGSGRRRKKKQRGQQTYSRREHVRGSVSRLASRARSVPRDRTHLSLTSSSPSSSVRAREIGGPGRRERGRERASAAVGRVCVACFAELTRSFATLRFRGSRALGRVDKAVLNDK